jgi:hypothetical protein
LSFRYPIPQIILRKEDCLVRLSQTLVALIMVDCHFLLPLKSIGNISSSLNAGLPTENTCHHLQMSPFPGPVTMVQSFHEADFVKDLELIILTKLEPQGTRPVGSPHVKQPACAMCHVLCAMTDIGLTCGASTIVNDTFLQGHLIQLHSWHRH